MIYLFGFPTLRSLLIFSLNLQIKLACLGWTHRLLYTSICIIRTPLVGGSALFPAFDREQPLSSPFSLPFSPFPFLSGCRLANTPTEKGTRLEKIFQSGASSFLIVQRSIGAFPLWLYLPPVHFLLRTKGCTLPLPPPDGSRLCGGG